MLPAKWWILDKGSIICRLCPNSCVLLDGTTGVCGVRYAESGRLTTRAWGIGTHPISDPVEKKPLYHFLPGTKVLSFGLCGCNLTCSFCQNWHLSANHDFTFLMPLEPEDIVNMAKTNGCSAIAFTYNEPIISAEFCVEISNVAHHADIKTVVVSNGYIHNEAKSDFFDVMDAANIDLKGINPSFYTKHCSARPEPVLETLKYIVSTKRTWLEITNLLIPSLNDSDTDINGLVEWIGTQLGQDVPLHFSAFRPTHRVPNLSVTPLRTLTRAKDIALRHGLRYVYLGNTPHPQSTICPNCQTEVIRRVNYEVAEYDLIAGKCSVCNSEINGFF